MLATKEKNITNGITPLYDDPLLKTGSINYTGLYIRSFKKVRENGLKEDKEKESKRTETKRVLVLYAGVNHRVIVTNDPINFIDPYGLVNVAPEFSGSGPNNKYNAPYYEGMYTEPSSSVLAKIIAKHIANAAISLSLKVNQDFIIPVLDELFPKPAEAATIDTTRKQDCP